MARTTGTYATLKTSEGTIVCRLFEKEAPKTVANFIELAEGKREWSHPTTRAKSNDKLYDGTIFHRVIPDFMIQGGDPAGTGMGGPGYKFEDETKGSAHRFDKPGNEIVRLRRRRKPAAVRPRSFRQTSALVIPPVPLITWRAEDGSASHVRLSQAKISAFISRG